MTPPLTSHAAVGAELRAIAECLAEARRLLGEGQLVVLSDLETRTRAVCDAARALPVEDGRSLRPDLEALLYDLDSLATDLTDRFGPQARQGDSRTRRDRRTLGAAYRRDIPRAGGTTDQET